MRRRHPAFIVIMSIVTLGIYSIYWYVTTQSALHRRTNMGYSGGVAFFLSLVTCGIYGIYWQYLLGKEVHEAGSSNERSVLYLVISLIGFGWIVPILVQLDINSILDNGDDDGDED